MCDPGGETGMEGGGSSLWIPEIPSRNFSEEPFSSLIRLLSVECDGWHQSKSVLVGRNHLQTEINQSFVYSQQSPQTSNTPTQTIIFPFK